MDAQATARQLKNITIVCQGVASSPVEMEAMMEELPTKSLSLEGPPMK